MKKIHGLRLRSIMRVFNYTYRNNEDLYDLALDEWTKRLDLKEETIGVDMSIGTDTTVIRVIDLYGEAGKKNEFEKY